MFDYHNIRWIIMAPQMCPPTPSTLCLMHVVTCPRFRIYELELNQMQIHRSSYWIMQLPLSLSSFNPPPAALGDCGATDKGTTIDTCILYHHRSLILMNNSSSQQPTNYTTDEIIKMRRGVGMHCFICCTPFARSFGSCNRQNSRVVAAGFTWCCSGSWSVFHSSDLM